MLCFVAPCIVDAKVTIESDTLDYEKETSTYTAKGKVTIRKENTTLNADEMTYYEESSVAVAEGNVVYDDPLVNIRAKRAELNLELKTGTLYEAEVFSKKDNYHIRGLEIEKTGEDEYSLKKASFTTCDGPVPAWCFKGSDVDVTVGDKLKARNVTFNIVGQPVFYSPYLVTPIGNERKTGLLRPVLGYINSKGLHYGQPFYWAISENSDATFMLDGYTKRGLGEGLEYRFVETDSSKGNFWLYHIRDENFEQDFWELRGIYDRDRDARLTGYLNLNYINSRNFYNEYNPYVLTKAKGSIDSASYLTLTTGRFYESTGELSMKLDNSRLFLTSQYLVDLKAGVDSSTIAQRLPEVGYFMNPQRIGPVIFSLSSRLSNFWREGAVSGQRLDIYPRFFHSFGDVVVLSQSLGLRETAYSLVRSDDFGSSPHRESFDYSVTAQMRLIKRYGSIVHIVEPSLGYTFIPSGHSNLPLFDSTELYVRTSKVELALLNRFRDSKGEFLTLRVSQPYDSYSIDHHLLPLKLDVALQRPVNFRGELSYDADTGKVENFNSDISIALPNIATLTLGERYNRSEDIQFYTVGMSYIFSKTLSAEGNFWYDAKNGEFRDIIAKVKYQKQCWGVNVIVTKREKDYGISVLFDLFGLGTIKL